MINMWVCCEQKHLAHVPSARLHVHAKQSHYDIWRYLMMAATSYWPRVGSMRAHSKEKRKAVHPTALAKRKSSLYLLQTKSSAGILSIMSYKDLTWMIQLNAWKPTILHFSSRLILCTCSKNHSPSRLAWTAHEWNAVQSRASGRATAGQQSGSSCSCPFLRHIGM